VSITKKLVENKIISPPKFLVNSIHYETYMGSIAYGVSSDNSDLDVYGFCIPPKDIIFPHLRGEILGFGRNKKRFEQYQQHHLKFNDKQYDITIYSIVKYFNLAMENNPNIIDSLYTPINCVKHSTVVGNMVRESRDIFLHKGSWHKFKGYAFSSLHKMKSKEPIIGSKRRELIEKYGYDTKYAYHIFRLLDEVEQILTEGTIDLKRNKEQLKSVRRGEWTVEDIEKYFAKKESELETLYISSKLRYSPDEDSIKQLLMNCLEHHYGNLSSVILCPDKYKNVLLKIQEEIENII